MRIIEDSYYEHDEFGFVRVVNVSDELVKMQLNEEQKYVTGIGQIPVARSEEPSTFRDRASPADIDVSADLSEAGMDTTDA